MRNLILIFSILFLTSCEGYIILSGKITSEKNGVGIEAVKVELLDIPPRDYYDSVRNVYVDSFFYSNENGNFIARSKMISMVYGAPKYRIRVSKSGYQTQEIKISKNKRDSVFLIKLKEN